VGGGKTRPIGIITGFVLSFSAFTLALASLVGRLGLSAGVMRWAAAASIVAFGAVLVVPALKSRFAMLASRLASGGRAAAPGRGYAAGLLLGVSLGLVWSPCVGPIMASVITLALSQTVDLGSVAITLAYAAGTAVPLFLVMLGGRGLLTRVPFLTRHTEGVQRVFGALMLVTGVALVAGWDRQFQGWMLAAFPRYGSGLTAVERQERVQAQLDARESAPALSPRAAAR
jgi:cytochrome c biogenesis protein CcdA